MSAVIARRPAKDGRPSIAYRYAGDRAVLVEYGEMEFDLTLNFFMQDEGPDPTARIDRPTLREVGHDRAGRSVPDEAGEDQRDQVAVGLASSGERADRDRPAEDALAIRPRDG